MLSTPLTFEWECILCFLGTDLQNNFRISKQKQKCDISISVWGCVFLVRLHSSRRLCRGFTADRQTGWNQQRGTESLPCIRRYCSSSKQTFTSKIISHHGDWLVASPVPVKHPPSVVSHHPLVSRSVLARIAVIFGPRGGFSGSSVSLWCITTRRLHVWKNSVILIN